MSFSISEISRDGNIVQYGLYLDPAADPGQDGIGSFEFVLVFDPLALQFVSSSSIYASGFAGYTGELDADTGSVNFGAIALPNWTSFTDPLVTFEFDISSAGASEDLLLDEIRLDDILQDDANLTVITAVNNHPTGSVSISGTAEEDQTLTASDTLADADGLGDITYTWYASGSATPLGTGSSYTLTQAEAGKTITVVASYTDGAGNPESVPSASTAVVANLNDEPVGFSVSISGTAEEDSQLTANAGVTSDGDGLPAPLTFGYQWQSSSDGLHWGDIGGATAATFAPGDGEVDRLIRVIASYTDQQGTLETTTSAATAAIANVNDTPINFTVEITGSKSEGQTLTGNVGAVIDPDGVGELAYQWQRSNNSDGFDNIAGATGSSYTLVSADVGKQLRLLVSYVDDQGTSESALSDPTSAITNTNIEPSGLPQLSGTFEEGQTIEVDLSEISDQDGLPDPSEFSFQWQRSEDSGSSWTSIAGATEATLTLVNEDSANLVRVVVTYTDGGGTEESLASAGQQIDNVNNAPGGEVTVSGTTAVGYTLTAANDLTDEDGLGEITYTWYASGSEQPLGTGDSYTPTLDELGKTITVVASYTDQMGSAESVDSAATDAVADLNNLPTGLVIIIGEAAVGGELVAFNNLADEDGLGTLSYQWYADDTAIDGATGTHYQPGLFDKGKAITVVASYTDDLGRDESVSSDPTDPVANPGELIEGTPGPDTLSGGELDDRIFGFDGSDTLRGNGGDDELNGGGGIDHAVFDGAMLDFTLLRNAEQIEVSGPASSGNDLLIDVERLHFDDQSLAFDLDGHAGQVAKLLGAMIGKDDWYIPEYVGIGLDILDNPQFDFEALMGAALEVVLGANPSNAAVVSMLFQNIVGVTPSEADLNSLVGLLDSGEFTQVGLCVAAAEHPLNLYNIGLVGVGETLQDTGLEFVPL